MLRCCSLPTRHGPGLLSDVRSCHWQLPLTAACRVLLPRGMATGPSPCSPGIFLTILNPSTSHRERRADACTALSTHFTRPTPPLPAGNYIDHKCPFTGNVAIRGRILSGKVKSTKMTRTIVVRRDYLHYIKKYQR